MRERIQYETITSDPSEKQKMAVSFKKQSHGKILSTSFSR